MKSVTSCLVVGVLVGGLAGLVACEETPPVGSTGSAQPASTDSAPSATTTASASAAPAASDMPSAEPSAEPAPSADASASASSAAADPAPTGSGTAPAPSASAAATSKYDCGGKGQKACPMQGWMKGVMGRAMQSGDGAKIAQALSTVAAKTPPGGYGQWASIAAGGAAKAQAGDIDGAKQSCKQCHSLYQKKYKDNQRDQPW